MNKPCVQCGKPLSVEDTFCDGCGASQSVVSSPAALPAAQPQRGSALGKLILVAFVSVGGWWWKHRTPSSSTPGAQPPVRQEQSSKAPPTALAVPMGNSQPGNQGTQATAPGTPAINDLMVMPWAVSRDGNFGIQVNAVTQGFPTGTTLFSGWVKELNGTGVATLDRNQRSPDGGLGFQTTTADRALGGFITSRSIGLPPGDYVLKIEVMAASSGVQARQSANFALNINPAHPDRVEVSPGTVAGGRRTVEFKFDITADLKLVGQRGVLHLQFRRADSQAAIPCTDSFFQNNGQLATAVQFQTRPEQLIDGLRMAVPFDLFPDTDCLMDLTIFDGNNQPVNRISGISFHPRG